MGKNKACQKKVFVENNMKTGSKVAKGQEAAVKIQPQQE